MCASDATPLNPVVAAVLGGVTMFTIAKVGGTDSKMFTIAKVGGADSKMVRSLRDP